MSSAILTCPLCSQPGFQTLDSLRYGLISAATRQVVCPVCHDVLYGLDKFTIHLFSHSVQHQQSPVHRFSPAPACKQQLYRQEEPNKFTKTDHSSYGAANNKPPPLHNVKIIWDEQTCKLLNSEGGSGVQNQNSLLSGIETKPKKPLESETKSVDLPDLEKPVHNPSTNISSMKKLTPLHQNSPVNVPSRKSSGDQSPIKPVKGIIRCDICGFAFDDSSILAIHCQLVHSMTVSEKETSNSRAQTCNGNKQTRGSDEKRQFPCHLCSKAFKMRGSLMVHLRVAHSNAIGTGKLLIGKLDPDNHAEERNFGCHLCSKSFKKEQHLSQHVKTHEGKQWECEVCCKMFTTKYFLKKHKRLHTGETPYSCDTCGKTFTFQQSYHKHLLYHSDDKPHVCTECDRAFKELSTLHNHQRIHTGEKPFACETCGKCFRQRVSYLVHRRIHTGAMPYQCTACGKSFRYKVSQRTHKCPSQPPGTVVRQSGNLVQKLLQGAEQRNTLAASQVPVAQVRVDCKKNSSCLEETRPSTSLRISEKQQQSMTNHFTIVVGNNDIFPIPQDSVFNESGVSSAGERKQAVTSARDEQLISAGMIDGSTSLSSQKLPVSYSSVQKETTVENRPAAQENNLDEELCKLKRITSNFNCDVGDLKRMQEEVTTKSNDARFLQETTANNDIYSDDFWKSSNKKQKSSDLVVETTDFFSMVMSPSGKSLPSPSERLKHLTLSSPVDTLLGYEDEGIYQFLLNTDDPGSSVQPRKNCEEKNNASLVEVPVQGEGGSAQSYESASSEPLQTINEESLKQLLYGSSRS